MKDAYSGAVLGTVSVSYFAQQAQIEVTGKDGTLLATASAGNNGAATLDFGEMPYGYTPAQYSQTVTVKNTGNVAVEVGYTGGSDWQEKGWASRHVSRARRAVVIFGCECKIMLRLSPACIWAIRLP